MAETPDKPVYLITGGDRPKIEKALARLRRHFEPEAVELVFAQEISGGAAAALCNTGSLFGDRRLVVVDGVDGQPNAERRLVNGWKAADVKAIEEYLGSPAPTTVLALVAAELKKDAPLTKACAKHGEVLAYEVAKKNKTVAPWLAERFRRAGARAEPEAAAALLQLVGEDVRQLANEVDKLATWAAGEPIGEREVELLVPSLADVPIWELTDAWAQREIARALGKSEALLEREGKSRRDTVPRLAAALANHVARVRQCQKIAAEGGRARDAASALKMHPFRAEKMFAQAANFSPEELRDAVVRLAALDLALKGKSKLAPDLELQRALVDLAGER
ncbi:MAG: DNA polymerase III subunit delta [Actinobacteria bacterium]|nr:DNA polymerase III subunit delta [Actinomycetota bacterium]